MPSSSAEGEPAGRSLKAAVILCAVLVAIITVVRAVAAWRNDSHLEHVSAAWIALATDLTHGIFYRAPVSDIGYGGTRFFPLYFGMHAGLMKLSMGWRCSGYLLSGVSFLLLLTGMYVALRRAGAGGWLAGAATATLLAGSSAQDAFLTIREDGMAAMFTVWGVALCLGEARPRHHFYLAMVLFCLAFATKETSLSGPAAVFLALLLQPRRREAVSFAAMMAVGGFFVLAIVLVASHGRMFEIFRLTARAGMNWGGLVNSPFNLLQIVPGYTAEVILIALAAGWQLLRPAHTLRRLPGLLFVCTLAVTLVIFSSEGTGGNHLLDLHVAALLAVCGVAAETRAQQWGAAALVGTCLVAAAGLIVQHRNADLTPVRANVEEVLAAIGPADRPILSDDPLLPISAGQQPYVMDAFMLRVMRERVPGIEEPLWRKLDHEEFAAVALIDNPESDEGRQTYTGSHFGPGFVEHLLKSYRAAGTPGDWFLYLPKAGKEKSRRLGQDGAQGKP